MNSKRSCFLFLGGLLLLGLAIQVHSECTEIVSQYFKCKHLKMIKSGSYYKPDPTVPDNKLDDAFYRSQGLQYMGIGQAMDLIRNIYRENAECEDPKFCDCVSSRKPDWTFWVRNSSAIFLKNEIVESTKEILADFVDLYRDDLLPYEDIEWIYGSSETESPTLNRFCIEHEYSFYRIYFYKGKLESCVSYPDDDYSCLWQTTVSNRSLITTETNEQLETKLICAIQGLSNCSLEFQRYYVLDFWSQVYPEYDWGNADGKFIEKLDDLIEKANNFEPEVDIIYAYMYLSDDRLIGSTVWNEWIHARANTTNVTLNMLTSSLLNVDIERRVKDEEAAFGEDESYGENQISKVHLTFKLPATSDPSTITYTIVGNTIPDEDNQKTFKDNNGINIFEIINRGYQLEIYDFNANVSIWLDDYFIDLTIPENLASEATGVFIDGLGNDIEVDDDNEEEAVASTQEPAVVAARKRRSIERGYYSN